LTRKEKMARCLVEILNNKYCLNINKLIKYTHCMLHY
jgi:hypothetical protein